MSNLVQHFMGAVNHGPEFQQGEGLPMSPEASLPVEHGTGAGQFDCERDKQQKWRQQQQHGAADTILPEAGCLPPLFFRLTQFHRLVVLGPLFELS